MKTANSTIAPGYRRLAPLTMVATTVALRFVPAGVATLVISRVAHKPLRLLLGVVLEPVLRTGVKKFTQRWHNKP